jgi:hypothetical protein
MSLSGLRLRLLILIALITRVLSLGLLIASGLAGEGLQEGSRVMRIGGERVLRELSLRKRGLRELSLRKRGLSKICGGLRIV